MRFVSGPPDLVNTVRRKDVMGTALSAPGHSVSCDICCFPVALQPAHRPRRNPRLDLALDPDGLAADAPCARKFSLAHPSQSVGKVTGTRASTCAFDKSRVGSITSCCSCSCPVKALAATGAFTFSLSFCLRVRNGNLPNVGSAAVRMLFEMKTPARRNAPMSAVCGRPAAEPQRARVLLPYGPYLVEGWGPAQGA